MHVATLHQRPTERHLIAQRRIVAARTLVDLLTHNPDDTENVPGERVRATLPR